MKNHVSLLYLPTYNCNLNCSYCYLNNHREQKKQTVLEDAKQLRTLAEKDNLEYKIFVHGGEFTTVHAHEIKQFIETLKDISTFGFQSNAYKISDEYFELFKEIYNNQEYKTSHFSITVDFPKAVHDKYRNNSYDATMANIEKLASLNVKLSLIIGVYNETINHIYDFLTDIKSIQNKKYIDTLKLNFIAGGEHTMTEKNQQLFFELLKSNDLIYFLYGKDVASFLDRQLQVCTAKPYCMFMTFFDGAIKNCHRLFGAQQSVLAPIYKNVPKDCAECEYYHLCYGGCLADKIDAGTDKNPFCTFMHNILDYYFYKTEK